MRKVPVWRAGSSCMIGGAAVKLRHN